MSPRRLIVNADDLGFDERVDRGILEAHEHGIVTSASLMVHGRSTAGAVAAAAECPRLSIGLHIDLVESVYENWEWKVLYSRVDTGDGALVRAEIEAQLLRFRELTGRDPTHLDSHQHVHLEEPVRSAATELARRLDLPLRSVSPSIAYCGSFYGQTGRGEPYPEGISVAGLVDAISRIGEGTTELGCHPGREVDRSLSVYASERAEEVQTLCSPDARSAIETGGIELVSFEGMRAG